VLPGFRGRDLDVQERMLRLWPVATLAVYFVLQSGWIYQALGGLTLPLAVLAVRAWRDARVPSLVLAAALAAVTIPGMVFLVERLASTTEDHFFRAGEREALAFLDRDSRAGAVLAPERIGLAVPGFTGRSTWVGHYQWTPDHVARRDTATALFSGAMAPPDAQRIVTESRAAFVLSDCGSTADLQPALGPLVTRVRRFGCAAVYEIGDGS
jgi:hypothetical protein